VNRRILIFISGLALLGVLAHRGRVLAQAAPTDF
jgi:hypothetical protein